MISRRKRHLLSLAILSALLGACAGDNGPSIGGANNDIGNNASFFGGPEGPDSNTPQDTDQDQDKNQNKPPKGSDKEGNSKSSDYDPLMTISNGVTHDNQGQHLNPMVSANGAGQTPLPTDNTAFDQAPFVAYFGPLKEGDPFDNRLNYFKKVISEAAGGGAGGGGGGGASKKPDTRWIDRYLADSYLVGTDHRHYILDPGFNLLNYDPGRDASAGVKPIPGYILSQLYNDAAMSPVTKYVKADGSEDPGKEHLALSFNYGNVLPVKERVLADKPDPTADPNEPGNVTIVYYPAYARAPSGPKWAYQTYLYYFNNDVEHQFADKAAIHHAYQSIGTETAQADIPKEGTASYLGFSTARLTDASHKAAQLTMENRVDVNFQNKTFNYQTVGMPLLHEVHSQGNQMTEHVATEVPQYAVQASGNFVKHQSGGMAFVGTAQTQGGLKGELHGAFYGPHVSEVGGVYALSDVDNTASTTRSVNLIGGFGAKNPKMDTSTQAKPDDNKGGNSAPVTTGTTATGS